MGRLRDFAILLVRRWTVIPAQGRTIMPPLGMLSNRVRITAWGMAKPIPWLDPVLDRIALGTPIKLPCMLTSAPPEFPGLIEASV